MQDTERRHSLVFALAHEIGNHLAGIRLEAHLLDEELGAHGLAKASLAIDSLAGQAAPLLAVLRPLLSPGSRRSAGGSLASVVDGVRRQLEEEGSAGHRVVAELGPEVGRAGAPFEGLHALLVALIGAPGALETPAGEIGSIALRLARAGDGVDLRVELPGDVFLEAAAETTAAEAARGASLRGRALALALARVLVADAGGAVEVGGDVARSWVALQLPG